MSRRTIARLMAVAFVASTVVVASPAHVFAGGQMGPLGSGPAVATSPWIGAGNFHVQWLFWEGTDGHIWRTFWDGNWHAPAGTSRSGQLGGRPAITITTGGFMYLFWRGTDNGLYEMTAVDDPGHAPRSWTDWNGPNKVPNTGNLGSDPAATSDVVGNVFVYWRGTGPGYGLFEDEWFVASGSWTGWHEVRNDQNGNGMGPLGSAPSAGAGVFNGHVYRSVIWKGMDSGFWATNYDLADPGWRPVYDLPGLGPLGSPPSAAYEPGGGTSSPAALWGWMGWYWAGAVPNYKDVWFTGPTPVCNGNLCDRPYGTLGSQPGAAADDNDNVFLFWKGTNSQLWEGFFNGSSLAWTPSSSDVLWQVQ